MTLPIEEDGLMSEELVAFLRARIDEDERVARAASGPKARYTRWDLSEWHGREEPHCLIGQGTPDQPCVLGHFTSDPVPTVQGEHIARHDPDRVLRRVEGERRILARHAACGSGSGYCDEGGHGWDDSPGGGCPDLADLALLYADHPDYRDEWRP